MNKKMVWMELDPQGRPIRIIKHPKDRFSLPDERLLLTEHSKAVGVIRWQVFKRSEGYCEFCGQPITWKTMHMHEQQFKGQGGEVSLENSAAICYDCHLGRDNSEHGDRRWGGRKR